LMTGAGKLAERPPMVWIFPEYGGQVAVRMGDLKAVRKNLARPNPKNRGQWEVYDLAKDPSETRDLAAERPEVVAQAVAILEREDAGNALFPLDWRR